MTSYKPTVRACYLGTVCQAIIINLTAILFVPLGQQFGLSYTQLGALVMVNFAIQVSVSLIFGPIVDRFGFRRFIVGAHIAAVIGMAWFAAAGRVPIDPYIVLLSGTMIFAIAGGFLELLLSPILNAIPTDEKSSAMSILHAFFCFGHLAVAILTTVFLHIFGREAWPFVLLIWGMVPLVNIFLFALSPIAEATPVAQQSKAKKIARQPLFIVLVFAILFAGASELTFSQWTSAFLEQVMELPKILGDIAGVGMFAAMMGVGRLGYGILKKKETKWLPAQSKLMLMGSGLAVISYFVMAFTNIPILALIACALCGLGVSLLWPGTLSLAVDAFPMAGTWMFAILAAAGSSGASAGPSLFGVIGDGLGLRAGFMITAVFPLGSILCLWLYHRLKPQGKN
ncbi:MAG: MFS transporter [Defluviitaleaceae bacterium]|nr:MFS transporter [Defluviitaleaceae bacterium]